MVIGVRALVRSEHYRQHANPDAERRQVDQLVAEVTTVIPAQLV
jgi:hypothetical protein